MAPIRVIPADVGGVGESLCDLADDLAGTDGTWLGTCQGHGDATGEFGAPAAFDAMVTAWDKQFTVLYTALEELCGRISGAAGAYVTVDGHAYPVSPDRGEY